MPIIERIRNICVSPGTEWMVIEAERTPPADLVAGYLAPLAAAGAVAAFVGRSIVGTAVPMIGTYRQPLLSGLVGAIFTFVMVLVACVVVAFLINTLAPAFGGRQDQGQAFKVAVYAYTPALVATALAVIPALGAMIGLVAAVYSLYLLYLGLPPLMKARSDKALPYTGVVVVASIIVFVAISVVMTLVTGAGLPIGG